jgi:hypothetical protein
METKINLHPMELQPVLERTFHYSTRPTLLNCRLVCKLWKQEVDKTGRDLRPVKRQVFETPQTLTCITQYMDITDRVSLSLSCKVLYGRMNDFGSLSKDMEKYNEKREEIRENKKGRLYYYYRNINKLNLLASTTLGTALFSVEGLLANIPASFYQMFTLKDYVTTKESYASIKKVVDKDKELLEALGTLFSYIGKGSNLPDLEKIGEGIKKANNAIKNPHTIERLGKGKIKILFADMQSGALARFMVTNKWKMLIGATMLGAIGFGMYQRQIAKDAYLPEWDAKMQEYERTTTIPIPNEVLKKFGISKELLPPFPVYCNCSFIDEKLEMKFFTNEEEEIECTHGGHLISLEESKQDLQNKVCSSTGLKVSEKSHIPLVTVLVDLQREATKKEILS